VKRASGSPTNSTARAAASATSSARDEARPTSSLATITIRRAKKRGFSRIEQRQKPKERRVGIGAAQ
jgi:hypothetical protein